MQRAACRYTFSASLLGIVLLSASDVGAQAPTGMAPGERYIGQPLDVPESVPIEVRKVVATGAGVAGTLVNASSQRIVAYEVALLRWGDDGQRRVDAVMSGSGLGWEPGVAAVVMLSSQPLAEDARVVPTAAIIADGSGFGDAAVVERFRREWRQRYDGLTGVLGMLDDALAPATEDDLAVLIDQVALAMARAPITRHGTGQLEPYMQTVAALKRLQGRGMVGTERFARELHGIRSRLQQELDERRRTPALLGGGADAGHVR